jgi:hypothetical protein
MNMRRSMPMVANKSIALVFSMILNPLGPIRIPDTINPMRLGILNFLSITGDISITRSIMANTRTGSFIGSCVKLLIWSRLRFNDYIFMMMIGHAI